jgi:two-component system phosphate regulon sensor histidine kinase PhoR
MNKKVLYLIITLICTSLLGIIAVQFFWIRNAIQVREAQFDQNVFDAIGLAVNKLETQENVFFIGKNHIGDSIRNLFRAFSKEQEMLSESKLDSLLTLEEKKTSPPPPSYPFHPRVLTYDLTYNMLTTKGGVVIDSVFYKNDQGNSENAINNPYVFFNWNDEEFIRLDSLFRKSDPDFINEQSDFHFETGGSEGHEMIIQYSVKPINSPPPPPPPPPDRNHRIFKEQVRKLNKKAIKVQDVIKKMTLEMESKPRPIEERINKTELGKILKKVFADKDIDQDFEFAVITPEETKPLTLVRSDGFKPDYLSTKYRISLFPNDIFQKQNTLLVKFPGSGSSILTSLSWLMIASILFTLVIVISSGLSIFVIIRQKKTSDIKTDFINNMTHEFKTPIATISIAVDSINNPKVIQQPEIIKNYTRVIKEENIRMNTRVEQVLQMALLDSSEFKLNEKIIDIHELIRKVTDNIRLQTESRNGQLNLHLEALQTMVMADESHMNNVLISILDNAIKYSPENPTIMVSTINSGNNIVISIEDHGIGMNSETQKKIFDKFFRVTSGNIHNIKGFGLGLSYAKAIVLSHKGEIKVKSEVDKGSRFEVSLPNISNELMN